MIWSDPDELNARVSINKITDNTNQLLDNQTLTWWKHSNILNYNFHDEQSATTLMSTCFDPLDNQMI